MRELLQLRLGNLTGVVAVVAVALPFLAALLVVLDRFVRMSPSRRSLRTDLGYVILSPFTEVVARVVTTLAVTGCALAAHRHVGPELLQGFGPVVRQPRWLMLVEMLVLGDLIYYWVHRLAHTLPFLWRLHAVHHSTRHLRWSSALRAHPAEMYLHLVTAVPLFLMGFPVDALVPLAPVFTVYALLIHTNTHVSLRRVSYLVNTPVFHGWHHALDVKGAGTNFAGLFPLFDALFGTYQLPHHLPREVGIDDADMPDTLLGQLRHPFRGWPTSHDTAGSVLEHPVPLGHD